MIVQKSVGRQGRLCNQMFQLAFVISQAHKRGVRAAFQPWKYAEYFEGDFSARPLPNMHPVAERQFEFDPEFLDGLDWSADMDFSGYWQTFKYFDEDLIRKTFAFKPEFVESVLSNFSETFEKEVIAIHVRRGDYIGNASYETLTPVYYLSALEKHYPDWRQKNLLIFSDNADYARLHFGVFGNAYFAGGNEIEDLCLMSKCQKFIIANSSFSWWAAYLSGSKEVVRPTKHFAGNLLARCDIRDFYLPEWTPHEAEKIDLKDTTFLIPTSFDHPDRQKNLELILAMLVKDFSTNIIVMEQGGSKFEWTGEFFTYCKHPSLLFHRTAMINAMCRMSTTPIVVNYDCDVLLPPAQIMEAVRLIREGADIALPYEARFVRLPRKDWFAKIASARDIGVVAGVKFPLLRRGDAQSSGGAVFFNKESFWRGGGENENLISFSPDDAERIERFTKLGFSVKRVPGSIFHCEHHCGINSGTRHPYITANRDEWHKVSAMNKTELIEYVKTWQWANQE
jgi:hypothetical protein